MKIKNVDLKTILRTTKASAIRSGYPMQSGEPANMYNDADEDMSYEDWVRVQKLATKDGGHNNFLKGIIAQFDLQYTQYHTPQLQRYNWIDIISSQSKMHRIHKMDLIESCDYRVHPVIIGVCKQFISLYNSSDFYDHVVHTVAGKEYRFESKQDLYMYIINNIPLGFQLWMGVTTNYLQLRNIYKQRKNHKLEDWTDFCKWLETLPNSNYITE